MVFLHRLFFFSLLLVSINANGQSSFTVKYYAMTIHPFGDATAHLQPRKLDPNAVFVLNSGLFVGYEKFVYQDLVSVKFIQGALSDCSKGLALVSHLGVRGTLYQTPLHRLSVGLGPTYIVRESWKRFGNQYESSGFFNEANWDRWGLVQWKFIAYGVDVEYDYCIRKRDNLSISITPGLPLANIISIGWKHWIGKTYTRPLAPYVPK
ncbi:MAG: hypothetical protein JJ975_06130 [Bacteroidia bacterium]|nr:hypothetical protein [Bacteroidia bacterium]